MKNKELNRIEDFLHGDIIHVISNERNCGIDQTIYTALVVDSKDDGLIAIPQDFQAMLTNAAIKGTSWEISVECLLGNDVEIILLERFSELMDSKWT